jgi:hypothetical protein
MKSLPLRLLGFLSVFCFLLTSSCVNAVNLHPILSGPQLAQHTGAQTVALISDIAMPSLNIGDDDDDAAAPAPAKPQISYRPFCTAVWVGNESILTAAHCVRGYVKEKRQAAVMQALLDQGIPPLLIVIILGHVDLDSVDLTDETLNPIVRGMAEIAKTVPLVDPSTTLIPFIVQGEVTNIGEAPSTLHYSLASAVNTSQDLALLTVYGPHVEHEVVSLADNTPLVGESVAIIGQASGHYWTYRVGVVSAYRHRISVMPLDGPFLQISADLVPGDSGGGTFNQRGQLVGINSFVSPALVGGFCIHLETIRGFLAGQHLVTLPMDPKVDESKIVDAETL